MHQGLRRRLKHSPQDRTNGQLRKRRRPGYIKKQRRRLSACRVGWIAPKVFGSVYYLTRLLDDPSNRFGIQSANEYPSQGSPQSSTRSAPPQVDTTRWATAEEEKIRLFTQAQNNARIVQGYAQDLNDSRASHGRGASRDSSRSFQQSSSGRPPVISAGAALYSHAMATVNKSSWGPPVSTPSPMQPPASHTSQSSRPPTAAEEKEMLRRYHDATSAVQRHHEANFGPSDGVMATASTSLPHDASTGSYPGDRDHSYGSVPDELPPPWVPSAEFSQTEAMSEKERYRIAFEARERAAAQQQPGSPPPSASPPVSPPADYYTATGTHPDVNGSDPGLMVAVDGGQPPPWQPPPPTQPGLPPHLRARSQPMPPSSPGKPGSPRVMSAAEEKAMLKAKYEEEETKTLPPPSPPQKAHSPSSPGRVFTSPTTQTQTPPHTPPPLMPRPPASYIQETAEEDARLQDELANGKSSASVNGNGNAHTALTRSATGVGIVTANATAPALLARRASTSHGAISLGNDVLGPLPPSSPFTIGWDSIAARDGSGTNGFVVASSPASSPPPLPPKVPLEH